MYKLLISKTSHSVAACKEERRIVDCFGFMPKTARKVWRSGKVLFYQITLQGTIIFQTHQHNAGFFLLFKKLNLVRVGKECVKFNMHSLVRRNGDVIP